MTWFFPRFHPYQNGYWVLFNSYCESEETRHPRRELGPISEGEGIRVEISIKFRIPALLSGLEAVGLSIICVMTYPANAFALTLARRQ